MTRFIHVALVTLCLPVTAAAQDEVLLPPTMTTEGIGPLPRVAEARRTHLLGLVPLYDLAVYVDGSLADRLRLAAADVPKAIRIEIRYAEDLRRRMPVDWRRELVPVLDESGTTHLRGVFAPLRHGDTVLIEYVPGRGTTVRVNRMIAVSGAHHELVLAFLDHWLGQRPVSEDMKQDLLTSSQAGPRAHSGI